MKAKIRTIIIIAAVLLVLGGAVLALVLTAPKEEEESAPQASAPESSLLFDKPYTSVGRITVTNSFGAYEIHRYGEDPESYLWDVPEYVEFPVNYAAVQDIVEKGATLTAQKTVVENAPDLSIYGLASPQAEYKTEFDDSGLTAWDVCIGDRVPGTSNMNYMCLKGENTVYTVKYSEVSCFTEDKRELIQKTLYTARTAKDENDTTNYSLIDKMVVSRKDIDYDIVIEYDKRLDEEDVVVGNSSQYRMTSPVLLDLNPDKCSDIMTGVFGLTAMDFAELAPTDEQLEEYGLADPFANIMIDVAGVDKVELSVGNEYFDEDGKSAGYYARLDGISVVYIFDKAALPWATFMPLDVTSAMITSNYVFGVKEMNVITKDINAHFTMTGSSDKDYEVKLNGGDVDKDRFKSFYQFMLAAPPEQLYIGEVSGEPYVKVEIITEKTRETLEFYPIESRRSIISLNGVPQFTCKTAYVDRLAENILKFSRGEDMITNW